MSEAGALRARSEALSAGLPALLAGAEALARTVLLGAHGRRRAGPGENFWEFRPAGSYDEPRRIDWRRSARSDETFVQDKEWQIAQSVTLWVDGSASMQFASAGPGKSARAAELALALAILLERGGERVGLGAPEIAPRLGRAQIEGLARALVRQIGGGEGAQEYGVPQLGTVPKGARAVMISDFLGDLSEVKRALEGAAARGCRGLILQVLDPEEESFPYRGRMIFESMGGGLSHETLHAGHLRTQYLDRLAERRAALADLARAAGWRLGHHRVDRPATEALLWLWKGLEAPR